MNPNELPPSAVLMQLLSGKALTACLSAMAKLGIADHMGAEPVTPEWLGEQTHCHAPSLYRVMRMIATVGIMVEHPGRRFTLTPIGECLRADSAHSMKDTAVMVGDSWQFRGYEHLLHSVRTGNDAITAAYGKNIFEVFGETPDESENFNRCMTNYSEREIVVLDEVMDFSAFKRMVDVGGGHGMLLSHILRKTPGLRGVLYDLPAVVGGAVSAGHFKDCQDRVSFESGSMFERVPEGCDAYIMKHIVHDWSEEHCHKILRLMREQLALHAPKNGRVFLGEMIVPHGPEPSPAKFLDVEMLVMTVGGKERTVPEFSALFEDAGLELVGVKTTKGPICLIEARVAQ